MDGKNFGLKCIVGLVLVCAPLLALAFPLWLDSPTRDNPADPKAPGHKEAVFPLNVPTPTPTVTPTASITPTWTSSPTFSASPTYSSSPTSTPTHTPGATYDDFENTAGNWVDTMDAQGGGSTWGPFYPGDNSGTGYGCVPTESVWFAAQRSATEFHTGAYSWKMTGTASSVDCTFYGYPYWGLNRSSDYAGIPVDLSGGLYAGPPANFVMWVKVDQNVQFNAYLPESNTAAPSDGEVWVTASPIAISASASWQKITVAIPSGFVNDGTYYGNGTLDLNNLNGPWFYFTADTIGCPSACGPNVNMYVDDIGFEY
jgi:hypothetical protein